MRVSRLACLAGAWCLAVQGCGGTAFTLPPVDDREALLAAQEIDADPNLPVFERSDAHYRETISRLARQLTERVASICARAETEQCRFTFRYVDDDEVNAHVDGDAQIYLHRGLLDYLEADEEIAAVMAHEMSHQIAGHVDESTRSIVLGALLGGLLMGGAAAAGGADQASANDAAGMGMTFGGRVGQLSFSKEQEREADLLAAYVLARAGFDLRAHAAFIFVRGKPNAPPSS